MAASSDVPGRSWLVSSDTNAFDELESGNSVWPTIFCGIQYPWFVLGRIAELMGLVDRDMALLIGLLYFIALVIAGAALEGVGLIGAGIFIHAAYVLGIFAVTLFLRRKLRAQYNIRGSTVIDSLSSIYPFSLWGLSLVERDLRARTVTSGTPAHRPQETGTWSQDLWQCYPDGCAVFQCAANCPWFVMTRLYVRLRNPWKLMAAASVFGLWVGGFIGFIGVDAGAQGRSTESALKVVFWLLSTCCGILSVFLTAKLRESVRARFNIQGDFAHDVALSFFCRPCVLTQMEHQTQVLVKDVETGAPEEMSVPELPLPQIPTAAAPVAPALIESQRLLVPSGGSADIRPVDHSEAPGHAAAAPGSRGAGRDCDPETPSSFTIV